MALISAPEAFAVAAAPPAAPVSYVRTVPVAPPTPLIGPPATASDVVLVGSGSTPTVSAAGAPPEQIVQGTRLLQQLSLASSSSIAGVIARHPASVEALLAHPPAAAEVSLWWASLDSAHRLALRAASPRLVGNLDGVPYAVRDLANRQLLSATIASLEATIRSDAGRTVIENAKQQLRMVSAINDSLGGAGSDPHRTLMTLDVTGQGRAAIVLGDLHSADYVTYLVPGMFFTIENQMGDWVDAAARLHDEQLSWLSLFGEPDSTVATVAWIGYDTPNLTNVGSIANAEQGRDSLAAAITGLQSLRAVDEPYLTVVAHSYGSTAALLALQEYDFDIDALALVGSPGSPATSVADLHVRGGNVFVGEAAWDPIPNSAYFGSDPGAASYGAQHLGVGGGIDALTRQVLLASTGHNEYFAAGTESMRNFALIGIGRGEFVTNGSTTASGVLAAGR